MKFIKGLISVLLGIITFCLCFKGADNIIHYITEGIIDPSTHDLMVIILWILGFSLIINAVIFGSILVVGILFKIFDLD